MTYFGSQATFPGLAGCGATAGAMSRIIPRTRTRVGHARVAGPRGTRPRPWLFNSSVALTSMCTLPTRACMAPSTGTCGSRLPMQSSNERCPTARSRRRRCTSVLRCCRRYARWPKKSAIRTARRSTSRLSRCAFAGWTAPFGHGNDSAVNVWSGNVWTAFTIARAHARSAADPRSDGWLAPSARWRRRRRAAGPARRPRPPDRSHAATGLG
jgi:hypothetical protein